MTSTFSASCFRPQLCDGGDEQAGPSERGDLAFFLEDLQIGEKQRRHQRRKNQQQQRQIVVDVESLRGGGTRVSRCVCVCVLCLFQAVRTLIGLQIAFKLNPIQIESEGTAETAEASRARERERERQVEFASDGSRSKEPNRKKEGEKMLTSLSFSFSLPFSKQAPPPPPPPPPSPPKSSEKTITDVIAGALARALSQSTIHPLDTLKVRMQAPPGALSKFGQLVPPPGSGRPRWSKRAMLRHGLRYRNKKAVALSLSRAGRELASLYRGVFGAASGAGVIIGTYFAFFSTAKRHLTNRVDPETGLPVFSPGSAAFAAGAAAAVGSSVVKVPLAVCIRSVQAGVYQNVFAAATQITRAAGARGLFTGFVPTLLEDVPDMGVKFAVYESLRAAHARLTDNRPPTTAEDLLIGGTAGAAAAAATTPLDVLKTGMMVSAARSPTMAGALASALERGGPRALFAGVGPRALSNGLNSAVFFCFFEAIRGGLVAAGERRKETEGKAAAAAAAAEKARAKAGRGESWGKKHNEQEQKQPLRISLPRLQLLGGARAKPAQLG